MSQTLPRDARLIALLLAANGAEDCEEGVVRMLVEFAHRYTTDVLTDSLLYAEHARSGAVNPTTSAVTPSLDDIRLAVQARTEGASVPKEFLLQLATTVNANPLPPVPEVYGVRLPPASQRLTAPNFTLVPRSAKPPPLPPTAMLDGGFDMGGAGGMEMYDHTADQQDQSGLDASAGAVPTAEGTDDDDSEGLFGGEDDDDDDDDDDEDMEDVTSGVAPVGGLNGAPAAGEEGSATASGQKRKAESEDEDYD